MSMISIIIPVYNVEKYIRQCFESILAQEHQDFEVLIVDDASTDSSGSICDEYVHKDCRFHAIHVKHHGIGYARNLAMSQMHGQYCFFLDPDDILETFSLRLLLDVMEKNQADIVLGISRNFQTENPPEVHEEKIERVYRGHKAICEEVLFDKNDLKPMERKENPALVNYEFFSSLYKVDLLRNHDIEFLPISYGEDTFVCFKYLLCCNCAVTVSVPVYWHRRNPTSTTFQYHPNYLEETKKYYNYYLGLFEQFGTDYLERARIGLDGQYMRRCMSALERELFYAPKSKKISEICSTIRNVYSDKKFHQWLTWEKLRRYSSKGWFRLLLYAVKLHLCPPYVFLFRLMQGHRKV